MESELILLTRILVSLGFLTLLSQFSKEWLYSSIVVNLILIGMLGSKTVSFFGFATNSGNVFYATIVFAIFLLIEHHGKESVKKGVAMATVFSLFSFFMAELIINTVGTVETHVFDEAMRTLLTQGPKLALASISAFVVSQFLNVSIYSALKERTKGAMVWLRALVSIVATQFVDSAIFFSIAFFSILQTGFLLEVMFTGFALKVAVGIISIPFLYLSLSLKKT